MVQEKKTAISLACENIRFSSLFVVCYTAVFSVVTQRSSTVMFICMTLSVSTSKSVERAWLKKKLRGIYWPPAQGDMGGSGARQCVQKERKEK